MTPEEKEYFLKRLLALELEHKKSTEEIQSLRDYLRLSSEIPETWEELNKVSGYYIDSFSKVERYLNRPTSDENKNIFASRNLAQSSLAQAQLSQLLYHSGNGWNRSLPNYGLFPEWSGEKYQPIVCQSFFPQFLAFRTQEKALDFYKKHETLIQQFWNQFQPDTETSHDEPVED